MLLRNRVSTVINVSGLALGIAAFVLILEYVALERSVNQFHANLPHLYTLLCEDRTGETWRYTEPGWGDKIKERLPEVADFCRFEDGIAQGIVTNPAQNASFREEQIGYAEGNFFDVFSFPLSAGSAAGLRAPNTVFVSERTAKKYFADEEPMGKTLRLFNQFGDRLYTVAGVFKDMGENSDMRYDMIFSLETLKNPANLNDNGWAALDGMESQFIYTFLLLRPGADPRALEAKLRALRRELLPEKTEVSFRLQAFAEAHLATSWTDTTYHTGNVRYVYMLYALALLILLVAWFNYVNLSTATLWKRAGEVGVRKAIGATRPLLMGQLLGESVLTNALAFVAALILVVVLQPLFNQLIDKNLSLSILSSSHTWAQGLLLLLFGTLASGSFTAYALSNQNPVEALRGRILNTLKGVWLRKSLVVSQFVISVGLILFTVVVYSQLHYMQNKNLGMDTEQRLVVKGPEAGRDSTYSTRRGTFWDFIAQQSYVTAHCLSGCVPGQSFNYSAEGFTTAQSGPGDENKPFSIAEIDDRYLATYGIELAAGRVPSQAECATKRADNDKILVNQRALQQLGIRSEAAALQTPVRYGDRNYTIIGVVKDYHHSSVQTAIEPIVFFPQNNSAYFTLKLTGGQLPEKIAALERQYKTCFPGNPFDYCFAEARFQEQYESEARYANLFTSASVLAIFIACLGLFGLAVFTAQQRTKEIGIRKVLGASVASVTALLAKDFLKLVLLAIVIASPIAYYFMQQWLADFAYRIELQWWMFAGAGAVAVLIAFFTVGFQSAKAALMNPVKSLRSE